MKKEVLNVSRDNAVILNGIRAQASQDYKNHVPILATPGGAGNNEYITDNLVEVLGAIRNYAPAYNEFVSALVNRIGLVIFKNMSYTNVLKNLKAGVLENGDTIEEIFVDIAKSYDYGWNPGEDEVNPFKRETPDVDALFHKLNVQKVFKTTTTEAELNLAFTNANGLISVVELIIGSVYTAYEVFEWEQTKKVLTDAFNNGDIVKEMIDDVDDEAGLKKLIEKARALSTKLTMPSKNYNVLERIQTTRKEDQLIFMTADLEASVDVNVLASAFNMDKTTFLGNRIVLDSFGPGLEDVKLMVADRRFFVIYDKLMRMESIYNPAQMYWNYFLHVWQLYSYSKYVNCVAFVVGEAAEVETADLTETDKTALQTTFSLDVDTTQDITVSGSLISGTLQKVDNVPTFDMTKGDHFLAVKFASDNASKIECKLDPSQSGVFVELDEDGVLLAQVTGNTKKIIVKASGADVAETTKVYTLDLTLAD